VVETRGRRVVVAHAGGNTVCFLAGERAVVGDRARFEDVPGSGGRLVEVLPRGNVLARADFKGREQILAANLGGLLIVASSVDPPFSPGLVDRYWVAAGASGLDAAVILNKCDLGVPDDVRVEIELRSAVGVPFLEVSARDPASIIRLADFLADKDGPWALVGHSGVGKTSLVQVLCPAEDAGEIGELSDYWGTGQHTTTHSRIFALPGGGEVVDSPGIRTFAPSGLDPEAVRRHFPGMLGLPCKYRDCRHRVGEEGCVAESTLPGGLVASYRRLLEDMERIDARVRP
jgi:ribosome biogenesis GTPase